MAVNYRDLTVYKKARELVIGTDRLIKSFPRTHQADVIAAQMFDSATSIGANIAEGKAKYTGKEYLRYLTHAQGSANETDHWLHTTLDCELATAEQVVPLLSLTVEVLKILSTARMTLTRQIESARPARVREPRSQYIVNPNEQIEPPNSSLLYLNSDDWDWILPPDWIDPLELDNP